MSSRRSIIRAAGLFATAGLAGCSASEDGDSTASSATPTDSPTPTDVESSESGGSNAGGSDRSDERDEAVEYVRNVEEMKGHFHSSVVLLGRGREDDAELHAGHGPDYFETVLTPLRNENPALTTRLRGRVVNLVDRVRSMDPDAYERHVTEDVLPLLDRAVETVVADEFRGSTAFGVRVMNALAGRITEEYEEGANDAGEVVNAGEYWDGRGFLYRIERRFEASSFDGRTADALDRFRSQIAAVEPPETVRGTSLQFRIGTSAGVGLPNATIESRDAALTYVRNAEEIRGHLHSSTVLAQAGDASNAAFHAHHGPDYATTVLPPVYRADATLATHILDRLVALPGRATSMDGGAYERYVSDSVLPLLDRATETAVPDQFPGTPSFEAAVILALGGRVEEEYSAAIPDGEVIDLYGEYWDARGFLSRMETRYAGIESDLDGEVRRQAGSELDTLRTELETARPAWDVSDSVDALRDIFSPVVDG